MASRHPSTPLAEARTENSPAQAQAQADVGGEDEASARMVLRVYEAMAAATGIFQRDLGLRRTQSDGPESAPSSGDSKVPSPPPHHPTPLPSPPTHRGSQPALLRRVLGETGVSAAELEAGACSCLCRLPLYARVQPQVLVAALWAMEALPALDAEAHGGPGARTGSPGCKVGGAGSEAGAGGGRRVFEELCLGQLGVGVKLRSQRLVCGPVPAGQVQAYLEEAEALSEDLLPIGDAIASSYPSTFQAVLLMYMGTFRRASGELSTCSPVLSCRQLRDIVAWAERLKVRFMEAGQGSLVQDVLAQGPLEQGVLDPVVDTYVTRRKEYVCACFRSQVQVLLEGAQGEQKGGFPGVAAEEVQVAVGVFERVQGELEAAQATQCHELVCRMAKALWECLADLHELLLEALGRTTTSGAPGVGPSSSQGAAEWALPGLVALANASAQCTVLAAQWENSISRWLPASECKGSRGFAHVTMEACRLLVKKAFQGLLIQGRLSDLYSDRWHESEGPTRDVLECLRAFLEAWKPQMKGAVLHFTARACLARLVLVYAEKLVHHGGTLSEATLMRLLKDVGDMERVFEPYVGGQAASDTVRVLVDLSNLANASRADSFVDAYSRMLATTWPECSAKAVHCIAEQATDLDEWAREEAMAECDRAWSLFVSQGASAMGQVQGPLDRDVSLARVGQLGIPSSS